MKRAESCLCDQFCVFCVGAAEFAVSAASVREVADLVPVVGVPQSADVLTGLCHHRNEFLPVLSLPAVLGEPCPQDLDCRFLLVMEGADGPWALPITRAVGLESLEIASQGTSLGDDPHNAMDPLRISRRSDRARTAESCSAGESNGDAPRPVIMGTASFRDGVVRILDADRLYQTAVDVLCEAWTVRDLRCGAPESPASLDPQVTC